MEEERTEKRVNKESGKHGIWQTRRGSGHTLPRDLMLQLLHLINLEFRNETILHNNNPRPAVAHTIFSHHLL